LEGGHRRKIWLMVSTSNPQIGQSIFCNILFF
jgi:hypothetical protein